jgi:uncharacterized protein with PIN domain
VGKKSTQSKDKYNEREYARYTIRIRKDDELYDKVEEFMVRNKYTSLNAIVSNRLREFFELSCIYQPEEEMCPTCRRSL